MAEGCHERPAVRQITLVMMMMYCIEKSTCDIVGTSRRRLNCAPLPPSLRPCPKAQALGHGCLASV